MFKTLIRHPKIISDKNLGIFLLHGYGSNENDLFTIADYFPDNYYVISIRAPKSLEFGGYAWYDIYFDNKNNKFSDDVQAMETVHELSAFIDSLKNKYSIDFKCDLLGFSQGAILSYSLAFNYPEKFNKIIALSGYFNDNLLPVQENYSKYEHLKFFVSHGLYDDIIPIDLARKIVPYLIERKVEYIYKEYTMMHEVSRDCLQDLSDWFSL